MEAEKLKTQVQTVLNYSFLFFFSFVIKYANL